MVAQVPTDARNTSHVFASPTMDYWSARNPRIGFFSLSLSPLLGSCFRRAGTCKYMCTLYARMRHARGGAAILLTA